MQEIPLSSVASQELTVVLNNQNCQITVYQTRFGLFCDLAVNNEPVVSGVLCHNANRIVRDAYLGFSGDLLFYDTQGTNDPSYTGFGTDPRFLFLYLTEDELSALGLNT